MQCGAVHVGIRRLEQTVKRSIASAQRDGGQVTCDRTLCPSQPLKPTIREREERHPERHKGGMTKCLGWEQVEGDYRNITNQWY